MSALIKTPIVIVDSRIAFALAQLLSLDGPLEVKCQRLGFTPSTTEDVLATADQFAHCAETAKQRALDVREGGHMSAARTPDSVGSVSVMVDSTEAAHILRCSPRHVRRRAAAGQFGAVRTPEGRWELNREAVLKAAGRRAA